MKKIFLMSLVLLMAVGGYAQRKSGSYGDLVVFGNIFTSNDNDDVVQAMAIKDGKYIFVGDSISALKYVGPKTQTIHGQPFVMAGATEAHGHYVGKYTLAYTALMPMCKTRQGVREALTDYIKKNPDRKCYLGFGFDYQAPEMSPNPDYDFAAFLDSICKDKAVAIFDKDGHQAICNTMALNKAFATRNIKVTDPSKEQIDRKTLPGGIILRLKNGRASGYMRDQAVPFITDATMSEFFTQEELHQALLNMQKQLHSLGYTNYLDAWIPVGMESSISLLKQLDSEGKLTVNIRPHYYIKSYDTQNEASAQTAVNKVAKINAINSTHSLPCDIKLFADGVTEGKTGLNFENYLDGSQGNECMSEDQFYWITRDANRAGIRIHTHGYGNKGVNRVINAYIKAQNEVKPKIHNSIAHVRNIIDTDFKRLADNNIYVAENINWHIGVDKDIYDVEMTYIPKDLFATGYPLKTFFETGCVMGSSTDAPAGAGSPDDAIGLMQLAVSPTYNKWWDHNAPVYPQAFNTPELISVKQALRTMTINGAKILAVDKERGSIEVGKYADFLLIDKNLLKIDKADLHTATLQSVYFEGKKVWNK